MEHNLHLIATAAALTDIGLVRNTNEDCIGVFGDSKIRGGIGLAVLADGMGGHSAGEVASKICVDTVYDFFSEKKLSANNSVAQCLHNAVALANERIYESALSNDHYKGMGSTICILRHNGNGNFYYAWVGDSRIYLLRDGVLSLLTRDDTVVNDLIDEGIITQQQASNHPYSHVVTQAVGTKKTIKNIHVVDEPLHAAIGDRFLMTSDGIHDFLDQDQIIRQLSTPDLHLACLNLITSAKEAQSTDNLSVIVVDVADGKLSVYDAQNAITKY